MSHVDQRDQGRAPVQIDGKCANPMQSPARRLTGLSQGPTLHLHAARAERERKVISERTIAALAAAKAPRTSPRQSQARRGPRDSQREPHGRRQRIRRQRCARHSRGPSRRGEDASADRRGAERSRHWDGAGRQVGTAGDRERASADRVSARPSLPRALCAHNPNRTAQRSCQPIERAFGQADVSSERKSVSLRAPRSAYSLATL